MRGASGRPGAPFACVAGSFPTPPLPESGGSPRPPLSAIAGRAHIAVAGRFTSCRRGRGYELSSDGCALPCDGPPRLDDWVRTLLTEPTPSSDRLGEPR